MDFDLNPEQREIQKAATDFANGVFDRDIIQVLCDGGKS
jgi:hypothetical protein